MINLIAVSNGLMVIPHFNNDFYTNSKYFKRVRVIQNI